MTVEYPSYLLVVFENGDGTTRSYATGFANETLTVDQQDAEGGTVASLDTGVATHRLDGYRLAVHAAAAIDRLEQEGGQ